MSTPDTFPRPCDHDHDNEPGRASCIWRWVRRSWSAITQPGSGGLEQPGDWRCRYKDGKATRWMSHGDADNMRRCFGGTLEWRGDFSQNTEVRQAPAGALSGPTGSTSSL